MFNVSVKTLDGRDSPFTLEEDEIPVDQQRLIFQGRVLQDDSLLKSCGVEDKVVHLVPRPPPSAIPQSSSGPSDPRQSRSIPVTVSNPAMNDLANGMSQALGTIATLMLNRFEGHEGRHPVSEQMRAGSGVDFATPHARLMTILENTFNRFHRQSTHLVRRIRQSSAVISPPSADAEEATDEEEVVTGSRDSSAPSYSPDERVICGDCQSRIEGVMNSDGVTDSVGVPDANTSLPPSVTTLRQENETEEIAVASSVKQADDQASPISTSAAVANTEGPSATRDIDTGNDIPSSSELPGAQDPSGGGRSGITISTLANMLARHRELWRSAEPYLDRWEAMLRKESQLQETEQDSQERAGTSAVEESGEANQSDDIWNTRFFCQVSRLLHLNAHMLHMISDVNILHLTPNSTTTRAPPATNTTAAATEATGQDPDATGVTEGQEQAPVSTVTQDSPPTASPTATEVDQATQRRRPRRILVDGSLARNRTSVEAFPRVTWSTPFGGTTPGMTIPTPVVTAPHATPTIPTRRSHSALDLHRGRSPTTVVTEGTQATPTSTRSQFSVGRGGTTAIIHRFDIPIVSMNMINIPNMRFMPVSGSGVAQVPLVSSSTFSGIGNPPISAEVIATAVATDGSGEDAGIPVASATIVLDDTVGSDSTTEPTTATITTTTTGAASASVAGPFRTATAGNRRTTGRSRPLTMMGPVDPYLPCQSRHFGLNSHSMQSRNALFEYIPVAGQTTTSTTSSGQSAPSASAPSNVSATTASTTTTSTDSRVYVQSSNGLPFNWHSDGDPLQQLTSVLSAVSAGVLQGQPPFNVVGSAGSAPAHVTVSNSSSPQSQSTGGGQSTPADTTGPQPSGLSSMLFGGESLLSSAMSMVTNLLNPRPETSQDRDQPQQGRQTAERPPSLDTPKWAESPGPATVGPTATGADVEGPSDRPVVLLDRLVGSHHLLPVFIEAVVDAVWLRLAQAIATDHPNGDELRLDSDVGSGNIKVEQPIAADQRSTTIPVGFLTDVLEAINRQLGPLGQSESSFNNLDYSRLDNLRPVFHHLIGHADRALRQMDGQVNLPDLILDCIFNSQTSDNRVSAVETTVEGRTLEWINRQLGSGTLVVDIRATIARFVRAHLALQTDLWRSSPTNVGFASTLLMAFGHGCVELFNLLDSLVAKLASSINLETESSGLIDFESIRNYLDRFANGLAGSDAMFCRALIFGIDRCIDRYQSTSAELLQLRRNHPPSQVMVFRSIPTTPSNVAVENNTSDTEMDDANYVDASDDLSLLGAGAEETRMTGIQPGTGSDRRGRCPPLPDWSNMVPVARPLESRVAEQQPQATTDICSASSSASTSPSRRGEGWKTSLPSQWVNVVAEDVARMAASAAGGLSGDQQPPRRPEPGAGIGYEQFSDGYLAGMPAKRRKVVEEHKLSLIKTPNSLFTECLTDAIRTSGCQPPQPSPPTVKTMACTQQTATAVPLSTTEETPASGQERNSSLTTGSPTAAVTREQMELVLALRNLVSERIANRLATDPDFDATLFPMSSKVFSRNNKNNLP